MIRHCTDDDNLVGAWPGDVLRGDPTHCGMTFDDVERSVLCPHPPLWPEFPSWVELLGWCIVAANECNQALEDLGMVKA